MNKQKRANRDWVILAWILLLAFVLRIIYLWQIVDAPDFIALRQDLDVQDYQARAMLSGDWSLREGVSDPHIPTTPYYRPPGYTYFLAVVYWLFDGSYLAPRLIQFTLGILHILLIYFLTRKLFNRVAGLCSAFLVSIYWAFIYYEGEVNDPALFIFLVPCILFCLHHAISKDFVLSSSLSGLLIGVYAIMRPNILLFIPFVILWMLFIYYQKRKLISCLFHILSLCLVAIAVIFPVTLRNYLVSGEFVPISTYFGENLLIGNSKDADGVTPWLPYLQDLEGTGNWSVWHYDNVVKGLGKSLGREVTHSEASNIFAKMALDYVIHHPWKTFVLTLKKAVLFWSPKEITENKVVEGERQYYIPLKYLPRFPIVLSTFLFGLLFLLHNIFRKKERIKTENIYLLSLILLFIFSYYISFLPFFVNARARVPLLGIMLIFGGYGIAEIINLLKTKKIKLAVLNNLILIFLFLLVHIEIIPYKPDMCRWHYDRADSFLRVGRVEEAIQEVYALMKQPERPMTYMPFRLGHAFAKLNYPELAVNLLRLALSPDPSEQPPMYREDIHYHIGAQLLKLKRYDEAIQEFEKALSINPKDPRAHNDLGVIYKDRGNLQKAESYFINSIEIEPEFNLAIINLTDLYVQQNKFLDAIQLLEKSLKLKPNDLEFLYNLGYVYHLSGRYDEALTYYNKVLSIKNNEPATLNNMAMIFLAKDDFEQAKKTLRLCIDKNPYYTLAYANYGDILYTENQKVEAAYFYNKGLETNPEHIGLRMALSRIYVELGQAAKGISELLEGLDKNPSSPDLWFALGNIYNGNKEYDKAIECFEKVISIDSSFVEAYQNLMEVYLIKKDIDKASELLEKAKQQIKDSEQIGFLLEKIQIIKEEKNK